MKFEEKLNIMHSELRDINSKYENALRDYKNLELSK